MAKINLLTMHYTDNNGSFFQTYATCRLLEECGHSVTIINLQDRNWNRGRWKRGISYYKLLRYLRFELARKKYYPPRTKMMFKVDTRLIPDADYNIVGSDQVWNHKITYYDFLSYFLSFSKPGIKRVSLASSFGTNWDLNAETTNLVKNELKQFTAISVREDIGVDTCKNVFNVNAIQVIDPTLGWGDFKPFLRKKGPINDNVTVFTYNSDGYTPKLADIVAEKYKWKKIWTNELPRCGFKSGLLFWENPIDWINAINQSSLLITDSFHGVAFAILLNRLFVATVNSINKMSRIYSLLSLFGLEERLVTSIDDFNNRFEAIIAPIDWMRVNSILKREQERIRVFIKNSIV